MSEAIESAEESAWPRGTVVSISRLPSGGQVMARALGIGELLDPLEVGRSALIRLDSDRALAPSVVTSIEALDRDTLRIVTDNHRYELRRLVGAPSSAALAAMHDAPAAPGHATDRTAPREHTCVVRVDPGTQARPGIFEAGARVVARCEKAGEVRELGRSILLSGLAPGEPLRMSTEQGVIGTSAVLHISRGQGGKVHVATANTAYTLWLDEEIEASTPTDRESPGAGEPGAR